MHSYLDHGRFLAFAHRGGALEAPENTMKAFSYAVGLGYAYLETDVYATRDGVLIAFHDDRLDRVTDRQGLIADMNWSEIRQARIGGAEPVPLLTDLLEAFPNARINIDTKHDAAVGPVMELIEKMNLFDRVCIGSFSDARLARIRARFGRKVCTSMGPREAGRFWASKWRLPAGRFDAQCAQLPVQQGPFRLVDRRAVAAAKRLGLPVYVWTIDREDEMETLIDLGVSGLMTDRPALLRDVLQRRGLWRGG